MRPTAYPAYKESGVAWLGEVPEHWEVKRLKTSAAYRVSNVDKLTKEDEFPVRLCNYTDVYYHDHINPDMELMEATATSEEIQRFGLKVDDIVITKDSEDWRDIAVPAHVEATKPNLVCGYHLAIITPSAALLNGKFLLRSFQSCAINQQFQIAASGVTRYGLPKSSIGEAVIPIPPLSEQTRIADFLDRETGRIDTLVAKKRALIGLLKEKRSALISRTVTRGLPAEVAHGFGLEPHTRFKDSGIEWLGEVPEGWEVKRLKYLFRCFGGGTPSKANPAFWEGDIPWVSPKDMSKKTVSDTEDHISKEAVFESATRMVSIGATLVVVRSGILKHTIPVATNLVPVTINQDMKALVSTGAVENSYLSYFIEGHNKSLLDVWSKNSCTVESIESNCMLDSMLPVPSLPEQTAIAAFLDRETARIDRLEEKVEAAIERLREYRTALITAAVTGKIDVREEVP